MKSHNYGFRHYGQIVCTGNVKKFNIEAKYSRNVVSHEFDHFDFKYD